MSKTAQELIVAVARIDTWKRNRNLLLDHYKKNGEIPLIVEKYYNRLIPLAYLHDRFGILGIAKKILSFFISIVGFFKPVREVRFSDMMFLKLQQKLLHLHARIL